MKRPKGKLVHGIGDDDNIDNMMIMLIMMTILTELRKRGRTQRQACARQNPQYSALLRAVARKKPIMTSIEKIDESVLGSIFV